METIEKIALVFMIICALNWGLINIMILFKYLDFE